MPFESLRPIADPLAAQVQLFHKQGLGNTMSLHTAQSGFPDLENVKFCIIGVREQRGAKVLSKNIVDFSGIRKAFYQLFPGNWNTGIADLGDIKPGDSLADTYYIVSKLTETLFKMKIIPIFLGGSQDLTYAIYRGYDKLDQMVNLVSVDSRFDLGDTTKPLSSTSYVGKIITEKPFNLFNFSNLGFQTFFNCQEEIDLMERLFFDSYRLGDAAAQIATVEPVLRDADIVSIDLASIQAESLGHMHAQMSNGFNGREICAICRYAGLSDRVSAFGIFEYVDTKGNELKTANFLVAQMIWYFMEGVNFRVNEMDIHNKKDFLHYAVPIDDEVLSFYKSIKTGRWWIEIPFLSGVNTKLKRHTLLPCGHQDYLNACNQEIPERWFKARRKNEL